MAQATTQNVIGEWAVRAPDAPAILADDRSPLTYRDLATQVGSTRDRIRAAGIGRTDRVALMHRNGPIAATAFLGVASAAVAAPLNPTYRRDEIAFYLTDLRARALVVGDGLDEAESVAAELGIPVLRIVDAGGAAGRFTLTGEIGGPAPAADPDPRAEDVALVLHTSGTTARPKLVPLTHGRLVASARTIATGLALTPDDRCLNVMPLFHIHGLVAAVLGTLVSGGSLVAMPGFLAPAFFRWLEAFDPTWYTAVPTIHAAVLARAANHGGIIDRSRLRFIRSSSATLPVSTSSGLETAFGVPVIEAYGMTEAAHQMASNPLPPAVRKPGSVGRATGIDIAILDAAGRTLPPGAIGEVGIRGATVFDGYDADPAINEAAFVDGWFRTGDQGELDDDGYLRIRGRLKELINRGGEKVAPVEIEEALLALPGVAQAVAFAVPDARLGETVGAAVVPDDGATLSEQAMQAALAARLAAFKVPDRIRILDEIPKGATGKVQRVGMAERLGLAGIEDGGSPPHDVSNESRPHREPTSATEQLVAGVWSDVLDVPGIGLDDDYFALGGDSMLAAIILTRIGERTGHRDLPLATFLWAPTVERFARGLDTGTWEVPSSPLLPIRTEGRRPPFFFIHIDDEIIGPTVLRRTLDPDQPIYGLRAIGIDGGDLPPSVDGLSETFLREIRLVQPDGPYFLGGYCSGGTVAIEMAKRLRSDGQEVALVGLVDPRVDLPHGPAWYLGRPAHFVRRAAEHLRERRFQAALLGIGRRVRMKTTKPRAGEPLGRDRFLDALAQDRRAAGPLRYPGSLTIFSSREYAVPRSFWDGVADRVDWAALPVRHQTFFQGEDGAVFAARLDAALAASGATAAASDAATDEPGVAT